MGNSKSKKTAPKPAPVVLCCNMKSMWQWQRAALTFDFCISVSPMEKLPPDVLAVCLHLLSGEWDIDITQPTDENLPLQTACAQVVAPPSAIKFSSVSQGVFAEATCFLRTSPNHGSTIRRISGVDVDDSIMLLFTGAESIEGFHSSFPEKALLHIADTCGPHITDISLTSKAMNGAVDIASSSLSIVKEAILKMPKLQKLSISTNAVSGAAVLEACIRQLNPRVLLYVEDLSLVSLTSEMCMIEPVDRVK